MRIGRRHIEGSDDSNLMKFVVYFWLCFPFLAEKLGNRIYKNDSIRDFVNNFFLK